MRALGGCVFVCALLIGVAGCQDDGPKASGTLAAQSAATPDLFAVEKTACDRKGGRWGIGASSATYVCYLTTRDANKHCTQASDCEGLCLAKSQTCAPFTPFYGCHDVLGAGGVRATLCRE